MFCSDSSHKSEFEDLWVYYIKLLQKNLKRLSLSRIWPSVSQGVHKYPYNPKSYSAMLTLSYLYSVSNNLRLTLDKCSQRWNLHPFPWQFFLYLCSKFFSECIGSLFFLTIFINCLNFPDFLFFWKILQIKVNLFRSKKILSLNFFSECLVLLFLAMFMHYALCFQTGIHSTLINYHCR